MEEDDYNSSSCLLRLELGDSYSSFDLEKAVCSHGLFMMAPNFWDPSTKTLQRPLRLSDCTTSLTVRISSSSSSSCLNVHVLGTHSVSPLDQQFLFGQVARMLRLSESEEMCIKEFHRIHPEAKERGFGRVFRSPTLFEDMVKCILLCNCQWPRTLTMVRALCELQLELKSDSFGHLGTEVASQDPSCLKAKTEDFLPRTPIGGESKRKRAGKKIAANLATKFSENETELEVDIKLTTNSDQLASYVLRREKPNPSFLLSVEEDDSCGKCNSCHLLNDDDEVDTYSISNPRMSKGRTDPSHRIGDFPSPKELADLDVNFLAKRCNLGYRANRIVKLAQSITEGRLQLAQLEEVVCNRAIPSLYDKLAEQLMEIDGFGPFTCANVLMCVGFYQAIPIDTETVRHLKKIHGIRCTLQTVQRDVEKVYGKYTPFQFLAYWSELWNFYENLFGKTSEMPPSNYHLITASNMRSKRKVNTSTRTKIS